MDYKLYNGAVTLSFDDAKHVYTVLGERVLSVTGVAAPKPALVYWASKMAAEYVRDNLKPGVALDEIQIAELCEAAKKAHSVISKKAANIGTLAHEKCELLAKTGIVDYPVNEQARKSFEQFLAWWRSHKIIVHASEFKVYHVDYEYAGTGDLDLTVDGIRGITDIKTSNAIYDDYQLQIAAYSKARERELGVKYEKGWILRLPKDGSGFEAKPITTMDEDFEAFLGLLKYYQWAA